MLDLASAAATIAQWIGEERADNRRFRSR